MEEQAPLRQQRILELDAEGNATASELSYADWKESRVALINGASRPSLRVMTVTASARSEPSKLSANEFENGGALADVVVERLERGAGQRPGGRRFGSLVHGLLASIDLNARPEAIRTGATTQARLVDAAEEEIEAALLVVTRALAHPLLRTASISGAAGMLRRETPIVLRKKDGSLVEGVVDLAFREESGAFDGWTVVDFKTDREFEFSSGYYISQVRLYVQAIAESTSQPARGVLLVV